MHNVLSRGALASWHSNSSGRVARLCGSTILLGCIACGAGRDKQESDAGPDRVQGTGGSATGGDETGNGGRASGVGGAAGAIIGVFTGGEGGSARGVGGVGGANGGRSGSGGSGAVGGGGGNQSGGGRGGTPAGGAGGNSVGGVGGASTCFEVGGRGGAGVGLGAGCTCRGMGFPLGTCPSGFICALGGEFFQGCIACPALCAAACTSLETDPQNCGACAHACGKTQVCSAGTCVCTAGTAECSPGFCSDLQTNPQNCGTCGHACSLVQQVCSNGTCEDSLCSGLRSCDCGSEVIAFTNGSGDELGRFPSINRLGAVAYAYQQKAGTVRIYSSRDQQVTSIGEFLVTDPLPRNPTSINAAGQVAFATSEPGVRQAVYRGDGQSLVQIADNSGDFVGFWGTPSVDEAGKVVFGAALPRNNQSSNPEAIFSGDGTTMTLIAQTDAELAGFDIGLRFGDPADDSGPMSNDAGEVVFTAQFVGVAMQGGLFTVAGGNRSTLALSGGVDGFTYFVGVPSVNAGGMVAFSASFESAPYSRVLTSTGGSLVERADLGSTGWPAIDDTGTIVGGFDAVGGFDVGLVLMSPTGKVTPIVGVGDKLFGSTVQDFSWSRHGFRGRGQLVLTVQLSDGRAVIMHACYATP